MNTEMKNEQQTKCGSCAADIMREELIAAIRVKMMEQYINRLIQYSMGTYELEEGEIVDFDEFEYIATRPIYLDDN
jgi:hypothetical protein